MHDNAIESIEKIIYRFYVLIIFIDISHNMNSSDDIFSTVMKIFDQFPYKFFEEWKNDDHK